MSSQISQSESQVHPGNLEDQIVIIQEDEPNSSNGLEGEAGNLDDAIRREVRERKQNAVSLVDFLKLSYLDRNLNDLFTLIPQEIRRSNDGVQIMLEYVSSLKHWELEADCIESGYANFPMRSKIKRMFVDGVTASVVPSFDGYRILLEIKHRFNKKYRYFIPSTLCASLYQTDEFQTFSFNTVDPLKFIEKLREGEYGTEPEDLDDEWLVDNAIIHNFDKQEVWVTAAALGIMHSERDLYDIPEKFLKTPS